MIERRNNQQASLSVYGSKFISLWVNENFKDNATCMHLAYGLIIILLTLILTLIVVIVVIIIVQMKLIDHSSKLYKQSLPAAVQRNAL